MFQFLILLSLVFAMSQSFGGNGGPGTGDALRSSLADVELAFTKATDNILPIMDEIEKELNQDGEALAISDPDLRWIFSRMLSKQKNATYPYQTEIFEDRISTHIKRETEPGCEFIKGLKAEAVTLKHEPGADICVDRPKLRRIPKEALLKHFTALMAHEFSHHFGAKQKIAKKVQDFVMYKLNSDCHVNINFNHVKDGMNTIIVYPRHWNFMGDGVVEQLLPLPSPGPNSAGLFTSTLVKVINTFSFFRKDLPDPQGTDMIKLETFNNPTEFAMNINRTKPSYMKVMVLNKDMSRTPFEIRWESVSWGDSYSNVAITGAAQVLQGKFSNETHNEDEPWVTVSGGCFYNWQHQD